MIFGRAWVLLFAWLPLLWLWFEWRRGSQRPAAALKALVLLAILLAIAEPQVPVSETKMAVSVLVDTSDSIPDKDLARASSLVTGIEKARGRHWTKIIPFARVTRNPEDSERAGSWKLRHTAGEPGRSTDLEAAVRAAVAGMPAGMVPRVVLISDGKENRGSIARAGWQAQQLGIPIDTYALAGRPRPGLLLESISMPSVAFSGEKFPIDLTVSSPKSAAGTVEITAEGKVLGRSQVAIEPGQSQLRVHTSVSSTGAIDLSGTIHAPELGDVHFSQALTLRRPKVLFISQDPAGTEQHLFATLESGQFDLVRSNNLMNENLEDYQLVVFNNWDLDSVPPARKADLEDFVKQGGGLLVIAGERNVYAENKTLEDPLDRSLPAKLAPPRSPEGTCVVLIVEKSSSMEGRKMELARMAAIGVIDNLRPVDMVGVLIFDNSFQWAVPIRKAEDRSLIKRLVAGITPDGGTQIAPALNEAYRKIRPVNATFKHIVLLTDGISEEGDSISLAKEAAGEKVTISTVGLGQDVNRAYLERVAALAKGRSYFLTDPSGLEQILLRDVMEHTGTTAIEKLIQPEVAKQAEILDGVGIETAPPLRGYVRFIAKPTSDTILTVERRDPLLSRWQYGLGRAAVFTSDAKSRWAERWVNWNGFDRFWTNVFRDLLPHSQAGEATAEFDSANGELVVNYRLARNVDEPDKVPDIYVFGPDGFQRPVAVRKVAEGAFSGHLPIGQRTGLFRVRPLVESRAFPEIGFYRQNEELNEFGSDDMLLRQVAEFTGGRFNPAPDEIFRAQGRSVPGVMRLWPGLIGLAVALNLVELVLRKWRGVRETLRG